MSEKLKYCPAQGTPYLKLDSKTDKTRYIVKARCKKWDCPYCAQVNKHQHYIRILNGCNELLNKKQQLNFVTITSHEHVRGLLRSYRVFQKAWKTLSQRARREVATATGIPLAYVLIPELHSDKTLHWHGVFTGGLSTRWWKDNSRQSGLGHQAKSVPLENGIQATNYCLKYVTKHIGQVVDIKRFRRVNYSQNFPAKPTIEGKHGFEVIDSKTALTTVIFEAWIKHQYRVMLHNQEVSEIIDNT
jgi:hypothetical protein